jgi:hypothetical protein
VEQFLVAFRSVALKALQDAEAAAKQTEADAVAAEGMADTGAE